MEKKISVTDRISAFKKIEFSNLFSELNEESLQEISENSSAEKEDQKIQKIGKVHSGEAKDVSTGNIDVGSEMIDERSSMGGEVGKKEGCIKVSEEDRDVKKVVEKERPIRKSIGESAVKVDCKIDVVDMDEDVSVEKVIPKKSRRRRKLVRGNSVNERRRFFESGEAFGYGYVDRKEGLVVKPLEKPEVFLDNDKKDNGMVHMKENPREKLLKENPAVKNRVATPKPSMKMIAPENKKVASIKNQVRPVKENPMVKKAVVSIKDEPDEFPAKEKKELEKEEEVEKEPKRRKKGLRKSMMFRKSDFESNNDVPQTSGVSSRLNFFKSLENVSVIDSIDHHHDDVVKGMCGICGEVEELVLLNKCTEHSNIYCAECFKMWLITKIMSNSKPTCPSCLRTLMYGEVTRFLSDEDDDTVNALRIFKSRLQDHLHSVHVPEIYELEMNGHKSRKETFIDMDDDTRNLVFDMTKPCPKCHTRIEKLGGCNHILCSCGHHFWWCCLNDYKTPEGNRAHYKKCQGIELD